MKKEKNPRIIKYVYYFCILYVIDNQVILTYNDWWYCLWGLFPVNWYLLDKKELSEDQADSVLKIVNSLKFNKEKNEKN